jgi:hypothetical protein
MAGITMCTELRPCICVQTGEHLLFHSWVYGDIALCEKEDGTIGCYDYSIIKFIDNKHREYDFTEKGGAK